MNGRVYDPDLGRFISADPHIQEPLNSQSLNRYSYTLNNPLSYTDPSGYFFGSIFKAIFKAVKSVVKAVVSVYKFIATNPVIQSLRTVAAGIICGPKCAAASAALNTAINGGSIGDIIKSAAITYVSAYASQELALSGLDYHVKIIASGVVHGTLAEAQGGSFLKGFVSGGVGAAISGSDFFQGIKSFEGRLVFSAIAGGVTAELGGGKFANGAATGAFAYAYGNIEGFGSANATSRGTPESGRGILDEYPNLIADNSGGPPTIYDKIEYSGALDLGLEGVYPEAYLLGGAAASSAIKAVGPLKQWIRVGPSYSRAAGQNISLSVRWGASPAGGGRYIRQIPSSIAQRFNQWLRGKKLPGNSWRTRDPGHLHIRK